jgi:methyl-accepting chemotaxis protein
MSFLELYWNVALTGTVLALISIGFVYRFILPARRIGRELETAITKLRQIKAEEDAHLTDLERVAAEVMQSTMLSHCWSEFTETLHGQTGVNSMGQETVVRYRATALAESFFTDQVLVETPLKTEFYKHLPGILTGIGIIGTFTGLILGLIHFQVTTNADQVRQSLAGLIQNVGHAFVVSASAIALAMISTWVEKSLVTQRYRQVEELCVLIDSLFDAGAGEEYLARLVQASETSATQAAQIKDALVADLKEILAEVTKQQIAASSIHNQQLSESMARTFSESLKEPITRISEAVERVSGNQGDAVNRMLTDVLSSFSSQMQEMFGGQLRGMNEVLLKTSESIQLAAGKFDQMAANMQNAGQGAVEQMAERMEAMIGAIESRQTAMNGQMAEFVEQIRQSVDGSQTESVEKMRSMMADLGSQVAHVVGQLDQQSKNAAAGHEEQVSKLEGQLDRFLKMTEVVVTRFQRETGEKMQSSLTELGDKTSGLVASLHEQGVQAANAHAERQSQFSQQSEEVLSRLAGEVGKLAGVVQNASDAMDRSVGQLASSTRDTVDRMNAGASTMNTAANSLSQGLDGMRQTASGIAGSSEKLATASDSMLEAARSVGGVMEQYRATRDSFAGIVENLRSVIESAKKEASMTTEIVARLTSATDKLGAAQESAEEYLEGISGVLGEAHEAFAENIERTLRAGNAQFHKELSEAVNRLKGAIQELGDTLDAVAVRG